MSRDVSVHPCLAEPLPAWTCVHPRLPPTDSPRGPRVLSCGTQTSPWWPERSERHTHNGCILLLISAHTPMGNRPRPRGTRVRNRKGMRHGAETQALFCDGRWNAPETKAIAGWRRDGAEVTENSGSRCSRLAIKSFPVFLVFESFRNEVSPSTALRQHIVRWF